MEFGDIIKIWHQIISTFPALLISTPFWSKNSTIFKWPRADASIKAVLPYYLTKMNVSILLLIDNYKIQFQKFNQISYFHSLYSLTSDCRSNVAPLLTRSCTTSRWPFIEAAKRAVTPYFQIQHYEHNIEFGDIIKIWHQIISTLFALLISEPFCSKNSTIFKWPRPDAKIKAVLPYYLTKINVSIL